MLSELRIFYKKNFLKSRGSKKKFKEKIFSIINYISEKEKKNFSVIGIIFCSDRYIRKLNNEYLDHDYETDIISFHDKDEEGNTEGELFISVDSVKENSKRFKTGFTEEMKRVIIHGILHLCGYDDKSVKQKNRMRLKENYYLRRI